MTDRFFFACGALLAGLAVAAGAFGAHALRAVLSPAALATFETAVRYQTVHALALLAIGWGCHPLALARHRLGGVADDGRGGVVLRQPLSAGADRQSRAGSGDADRRCVLAGGLVLPRGRGDATLSQAGAQANTGIA